MPISFSFSWFFVNYLQVKLASFVLFPFKLFQICESLHIKSSNLFKYYIKKENIKTASDLKALIDSKRKNEIQKNPSLMEKFYSLREVNLRPWDLDSLITSSNRFSNLINILTDFMWLNSRNSKKSENKTIELKQNNYSDSKFISFFMKRNVLWKNNDERLLEKLKNRHVFYDEYDF